MLLKEKCLLATTLLSCSLLAHAGFEAEPNDTIQKATPLRLNEIFTGSTESSPSIDYYKVELSSPSEINLHFKSNATANATTAYLYIYNSSEQLLLTRQVNGAEQNKTFQFNLVAGTYYVRVSAAAYDYYDYSYEISLESPLSIPRLVTIPSTVDTASLPDVNANGYEDFAILRVLSNASSVVDVVDGNTGKSIKRITYTTDSRAAQPISITGFNDIDNNGTPDIGVLFYNSIKGVNVQIVREAASGVLIKTFEEKPAQ